MSGIFPSAGVSAATALNSIKSPVLADGCEAQYYRNDCRPNFDPSQANAIISELLNVNKLTGLPYDCDRLDNLAQASRNHAITYDKTIGLPSDPYDVLNGDRTVLTGNFTVPNSYTKTITCLGICHLTLLVQELTSGERLLANLDLSSDNTFEQKLLHTTIQVNNLASPGVTYLSWQTTKTTFINIPPGGKLFYYKLTTESSAANAWKLKQDETAMKYRFFGINAHTYDDVSE